MFYVGQKVVCINAKDDVFPGTTEPWNVACDIPTEGTIYTVRATGIIFNGLPGLKFHEIIWRGLVRGLFRDDDWYWAERFRPVVERKTDISIFVKMLTPKRDTIRAYL
jgi:hypothetical protein